jgi:hypothetical protein
MGRRLRLPGHGHHRDHHHVCVDRAPLLLNSHSFVYNGTIVLLAHGPLPTEQFCELVAEESEGQVSKRDAKDALECYCAVITSSSSLRPRHVGL